MKSIDVKGTARTIAERSSEQAKALKARSVAPFGSGRGIRRSRRGRCE